MLIIVKLVGTLDAALQVEEPDIKFVKETRYLLHLKNVPTSYVQESLTDISDNNTSPELLKTSWNHRAMIFGGMAWSAQVSIIELLDHNWKEDSPFIVYVPASMVNKDMQLKVVLQNALEQQAISN